MAPSEDEVKMLDEIRVVTEMIRKHQGAIVQLADRRRGLILAVRARGGVSFKRIAETMGVTEQTVYRTLRDGQKGTVAP